MDQITACHEPNNIPGWSKEDSASASMQEVVQNLQAEDALEKEW